jgi:hypothetical protein
LVQTKEERKAYQKEYANRPENIAKRKLRQQTPEYKARQKEIANRPENKAKRKQVTSTSEYKAKKREIANRPENKANKKKWSSRPENKAKAKLRQQTPEYKAKKREYDFKLRQNPEHQAKVKTRQQTPEYKARQKELRDKPDNKVKAKMYNLRKDVMARKKELRDRPENKSKRRENWNLSLGAKVKSINTDRRLKILKHYSKHLSNSDIPCCNCCAENFHVDFLAIDHIAGRGKMDSELRLVKKGYSSKLKNAPLQRWIIENNFPVGFQILCQNCNFAKGMRGRNNKCPHERKREEETFAMMEEQSSFEFS